MSDLESARELAVSADLWEIRLRGGKSITVLANAYSVEGEEVVFSLLFKGSPNFEVDSLRIPIELFPEDFS